jgi:hypothetical protein
MLKGKGCCFSAFMEKELMKAMSTAAGRVLQPLPPKLNIFPVQGFLSYICSP